MAPVPARGSSVSVDPHRINEPCGQIIRLRDGSPVYFIVACAEPKGHTVKHRAIVAADMSESMHDRRRVTTEITWKDN